MRPKLLAALVFLLIGNMVVQAENRTTDFIASSFAMAPEVVIDTSKTEDKAFTYGIMSGTYFSFGKNASTLYVWMFCLRGAAMSIVKRTLDTTTLKPTVDDVMINTNVSQAARKVGLGVGYIGMPYKKRVDDVDQLFFFVLPVEATAEMSPLEVQLTNNNYSPIEYYYIATLFQDDVFYVVYNKYNQENNATTHATYLQGVKAKDGRLLYPEPVLVMPLNSSVDVALIKAGFDRVANASRIIITWKDRAREFVVQSTVNITNGKVTEPVTLTKDTDGWNWPQTVVASSTSSGVIVENTPFFNNAKSSLKLILNGDPNNSKTFDLQPPENYRLSYLTTIGRPNRFAAVAIYKNKDLKLMFRSFGDTGLPLDFQQEIASTTNGIEYPVYETLEHDFQFPVDANGVVWFGHCDYEDHTFKLEKCFVGKLMN